MTPQPRPLAGLVAVLLAVVALTAVGRPEPASAAPTTCPAGISLPNGDFEAPDVPAGPGHDISDTDADAAWRTTATDHQIEYWANGSGSTASNGNLAIEAESGSQWVELNATQASTLYQDVPTVPGQVMRWSLWHRARYTGTPGGQDVMSVLIGSTTSQVQQGGDISDGPQAWVNHTGSYVVPPGQTTTRFAFKAVSTSSGNTTVGNFLDDVVFSNAPCLSATSTVTDLTAGSGGLTRPGDRLRYAVSVRNTGGDGAGGVVVSDAVPDGTTYVPGSLTVGGAAATDQADSDAGEVSGAQVTARVGAGASGTAGGTVAAGAATTVTFEVTVDAGTAAGATLSDAPAGTYTWAPDPATYDAVTSPAESTVSTTGLDLATSVTGTTDVDGDGRLGVGDRVGYAFVVTDTGSVGLTSVAVAAAGAAGSVPVDCPSAALAPGGSETCTASYPVGQADVDAGSASVTATATGTPPSGAADLTSAPSAAGQPLDQSASLALAVTAPVTDTNGDGATDLGDVVTWTFRATNTGTVSLSGMRIDDPSVDGISCSSTHLAPGATATCTAAHTVSAADVKAGSVTTTATATGVDPGGAAVTSDPASADATVTVGSALRLLATATTADVDGDFRVDLGDRITWTYRVTDTGSTTVTDIGVTASTAGPVTCPLTTLTPGDSTVCTAVAHVIDQADVDAGVVSDTATLSATGGDGQPVTSDPSSTAVPVARTSALQLATATAVTDVNQDGRTDPGDTVDWTFLVTNTGTTTLTSLSVNDSATGGVSCPGAPLAPGATATCPAATHTVTQADVDTGGVTDTATAGALGPDGATVSSNRSTATTPVGPAGALQLTAEAAVTDLDGDFRIDLGDHVAWSFLLTNTGASALTAVTVNDAVGGPVSCPSAALAPGASETCTTAAPYVIGQADVDAGVVVQTAQATGTAPGGSTVTSNSSSTSTPVAQAPALTVALTPSVADRNGNGRTDLGDGVTWSYVVRNTGTVTLAAPSVTSTGAGPVSCPSPALPPGARATCVSGVHVVDQTDVAAGVVATTATATGRTPDGHTVTSPPVSAGVPVLQPAALSVSLAGVVADRDGDGRTDLGDQVTWQVVVTNSGSSTVAGLSVTGSGADAFSCPTATLAPQAATTCTSAPYLVAQADVDAGVVSTTARASGLDPQDGQVLSAPATATVPVTRLSSLQLTQTAAVADTDGSFTIDLGDQVTWGLKVRNTGTTTLSAVTVDDPAGGPVTCPAAPLPPGQTVSCSVAVHPVTQADVDAGVVSNTATASATGPDGSAVTSAPARADVPVARSSGLRVTVSATVTDVDNDGRTDLGDTVLWAFQVRNTGTVTLTSLAVADPGAAPVSCPAGPLPPSATVTCLSTAPYAVGPADVTAGHVDTTATATALDPTGAVVTSDASAGSTPVAQHPDPALTTTALVDDVNGDYLIDRGDQIRWSFLVQNTGDATITGIRVSDPLAGPVSCPVTTLGSGRSETCTAAPYAISQGDVDAGVVTNTATATATTATGVRTVSNLSTTTTPVAQRPALALSATATARDVDRDGWIDLGDTISWSFVVQNTGTTTLRSPAVSDPVAGPVACPVSALAPGASATCLARAPYVITQADVDANHVRSTATASAADPAGHPVGSAPAPTYTPVYQFSALTLLVAGAVTDVDGDGTTGVGDTVTWSFTVRNAGSTTLYGLVVSAPSAGTVGCPLTTLPVGATTVCTARVPHQITGADVDAGAVTTTATARAKDPNGWPLATRPTPGQVTLGPVGAVSVFTTSPPDRSPAVSRRGRLVLRD